MRNPKQLLKKLKGAVTSPTAKKIGLGALGIGAAVGVGYGAKKLYDRFGKRKTSRSSLARVRTRRKIWQEKTKLERAKKAYERVISQ